MIAMLSRFHRWLRSLLPTVLLSALLFVGASALEAEPAATQPWMKTINAHEPGAHGKLALCELEYNLSWNGVLTAGEATLVIGKRDPEYPQVLLGECKSSSEGLAKRLWYYKNFLRSAIRKDSLRPLLFEATEIEKKEKIMTRTAFDTEQVKAVTVTEDRKSGEKETKERAFANTHAFDLLSAVLYLRSQPLTPGQEVNMVVVPFDTPYLAKFRVLGRETFKSELGRHPAIKLDIKLYRIDRDDLSLKNADKFKQAHIWISDDEFRMPLEVRSEVFVGSIRASLQKRRFLQH